jgi:hypothetical protein
MFVVGAFIVPGYVIVAPGGASAAPPGPATWTFVVYVDGDNNLEQYWDANSLPWLMAVAPSDQVNIVALLDRRSTTGTQVLKISGSTVTVVETLGELDFGDPATVTWGINRAAALYPSTYFALTMWDHGWGWEFICQDTTSGSEIDMMELQGAIAASNKRLDVLAFDACCMGNAEAIYQVAQTNLVSYVVGSEEAVPGDGFPYDKMLTRLVNNPAMTPREFSAAMVDGWADYYNKIKSAAGYTLSAIDVSGMMASVGTFSAWSAKMLELQPSYKIYYEAARKSANKMWGADFADLYDYGYHLLGQSGVTDTGLRTATQNMMSSIGTYVVHKWNGAKMTDCGGITFWFGVRSYWTTYSADYLQLQFPINTGWGNFLTAYN